MNQFTLNDQSIAALLEAAGRRSSSFDGSNGGGNVNNTNNDARRSHELEQQYFLSSTGTNTNPIGVTPVPPSSLMTQQQEQLLLLNKLAGAASSSSLSNSGQQSHTGLGLSTSVANRQVDRDVTSSLLLPPSFTAEAQLRNTSNICRYLEQLGGNFPAVFNEGSLHSNLNPRASIGLPRHQTEQRPGSAPARAPVSNAFQHPFQQHQSFRSRDNAADYFRFQEQYQQHQQPVLSSSLVADLLTRLTGGTTDGGISSGPSYNQQENTPLQQIYQLQHALDAKGSSGNSNSAYSTTPVQSSSLFDANNAFTPGGVFSSGSSPCSQVQQESNSDFFARLLSAIISGRGHDSELASLLSSLAAVGSSKMNSTLLPSDKRAASTNNFADERQENHKNCLPVENGTTSVVAQSESSPSAALNDDDKDDIDSDSAEPGDDSSSDDESSKKTSATLTSHASKATKKIKSTTEHFPRKLHRMLSELEAESKADIISFFQHGRAFAIHKPREFVADIMTRYFRMSRLSSFQRQLNLYGFKRIAEGKDKGGYYHEFFIQGKPNLSKRIRRASTGSKAKMQQQQQQQQQQQHMLIQSLMSQKNVAAAGTHHQQGTGHVSQNDLATATTAIALGDLLKSISTEETRTAVRHLLNQDLNYNDIPPAEGLGAQEYASLANNDSRPGMLLNAALGSTGSGGVPSSLSPASSSSMPMYNISPAVQDLLLRAVLTMGIRANDSDQVSGAAKGNSLETLAGLAGLSPAALAVLQEQALHQHQQGFNPEAEKKSRSLLNALFQRQ